MRSEIVETLTNQHRFVDLFRLARYEYRIGEPLLDDAEYELLQDSLKDVESATIYLEQSYDDDEIPVDLLNEFGLEVVSFNKIASRSELYDYLNEDKSFSIQSVTDYKEAFQFFRFLASEHLDFVASLKMDGVNTKMLYTDGEFAISLSRGRKGDSFDYTDNSAKIMPAKLKSDKRMVKIVGESYVRPEDLQSLRDKYRKPTGYVTGKSAAISMLRVGHNDEDYKKLHTSIFYAEGLSDTLIGTYRVLEEQGFDTVPYLFFSWEKIPSNYEDFCKWLKENILDVIYRVSQGMPSDGVVIEVNDFNWLGTQHNQYVSRQLALKFEYWGYACYKGIVRDIKIEQKRVFKSVRVEIEPIKTRDGSNATVINSFNPSIIIDNDLEVGKEIYFERNSEAVNVMIHGERLKGLIKDSDEGGDYYGTEDGE